MSTLLVFIIVSTFWSSASAVEIDGIYYYLSENTATVTNKYQNSSSSKSDAYINAYSGTITIPSTVNYYGKDYTVTSIQDYAFFYCPDLKSVSLPSTISSIGSSVFYHDSSLKAIIVSSDNNYFSTVGGVLFNKDKTILICCPGAKTGDYTVPSTVKEIKNGAFFKCESITTVSLPNGITGIGKDAFSNCKALTSVNIPTCLTSLGEAAFYDDYSISSTITIPSGIKIIPRNCFRGCNALKSVTISEGVEEIGNSAFCWCNLIGKIELPSTIKKIGEECFHYCFSLQKVNIPEGITEIPRDAFNSCNLTTIDFPKTIQKIGESAFSSCPISTITIPKTITTIGNSAFGLNSLQEVNVYVYNTPSQIEIGNNLNTFSGNPLRIHVYSPLVEDFKNTVNWKNYANYFIGDIPVDPVKSINLDKTSLVMKPYSEDKLTAIVNPNYASIKDVIYTSSNEEAVVILDNTGRFMSLEPGTSTITATALDGSGVKATCKITVSDGIIQAESVTLNTTSTNILLGGTKTLKATILPDNATMKSVTWKSSNPNVATVDENGVVTGVNAGTATITATAADGKGAYAECKVNVVYNSIALTDASTSYSNDTEATTNTLKYTRTFSNTAWQALYVPFSMSYSDWSNDFEVAAINNVHQYDDDDNGTFDRTVLEIVKVKSGSLKPNTPYLIKAKKAGEKTIIISNANLKKTEINSIYCASVNTKYTFTGTYSTISGATMISNGYYAMGNGELVQAIDNTASLGAFRWYLKIESKEDGAYNAAKIAVICLDDEEEATAINENIVETDNKIVGIYDANGRKINELKNGLNIVKYSDGSTKKIIK